MRRVRLGLVAASLATYALLYTPQPLLPLIASGFRASPAAASLAMSAGTGALALAIIPVSSLSEVYGRGKVMTISVIAAGALGLVAPLAGSLGMIVGIRIVQGVALAGLPATAMAYLAEEVEQAYLGRVMGVYIAGNSVGGLSGRIISGALASAGGWRVATAGVGAMAFACAIAFVFLLPRSRFFIPAPLRLRALSATLWRNLADTALLRLYLIGFTMMGAFVTVYNYIAFRLSAAPFHLPTSVIGALFAVYLTGTYSSSAAGHLSDRIGSYRVLCTSIIVVATGAALTLPASLPFVVCGLIVLTGGFFAAHSVASGWVSSRARVAPAQASALYLCLYYVGGSLAGSAGGIFYSRGGWPLTIAFVAALLAAALSSAATLHRSLPCPAATPGPAATSGPAATLVVLPCDRTGRYPAALLPRRTAAPLSRRTAASLSRRTAATPDPAVTPASARWAPSRLFLLLSACA